MRRSARLLATAAMVTLVAPRGAHGAGYAIYEQGAAVMGKAGAGTASVNDASAMFFNPAALGRISGTRLMLGGTVLSPSTTFDGQAPYPGVGVSEELKRRNFFPATIYLTHRCTSKWAVGAGFNSPFGIGVEWKNPDTFTGNYIVTKGTLQTYNAMLNAAYVVNDRWSVAVGGNAVMTSVELDRRRLTNLGPPFGLTDVAKINLKGDATPGYGWNAAVLFTPPVFLPIVRPATICQRLEKRLLAVNSMPL